MNTSGRKEGSIGLHCTGGLRRPRRSMPRPVQVHIRRSDKACEAKMNLELTDEDMILRIAAQCSPPLMPASPAGATPHAHAVQ